MCLIFERFREIRDAFSRGRFTGTRTDFSNAAALPGLRLRAMPARRSLDWKKSALVKQSATQRSGSCKYVDF
jgi:hypothetical protein